jgi:hypothetical protein
MPAPLDRGPVLHHAALHRLSPALRGGAPALLPPGEGAGGRCGWEPFFRALEARRLAVVLGEEGAAGTLVPRDGARPAEARSPPRRATAEARRFLRALVGKL